MAIRTPIIDVCTGSGQLGLGVKRAFRRVGIKPVTLAYVERESSAAAVLMARMAEKALDDAPVWDDLATFPCGMFRSAMAARGIVVAGIPCQGHSLAGKRQIANDERDGWPSTRRMLRSLHARWFVLENVRGILVPNRREQLEAGIRRVVEDLACDGWIAEWGVLSASAVGATHKRERLFLVANRDGRSSGPTNRHQLQRRRKNETEHAGMGCIELAHTGRECDQLGRDDRELAEATAANEGEARQREWNGDAVVGGGESMADTAVRRLAEWGFERGDAKSEFPATVRGSVRLPRFAPGRDDWQGWIDLLRIDPTLVPAVRRPERSRIPKGEEAIESAVRRTVDGLGAGLDLPRADRLRICGNGVVPDQAEWAVYQLLCRLINNYTAA